MGQLARILRAKKLKKKSGRVNLFATLSASWVGVGEFCAQCVGIGLEESVCVSDERGFDGSSFGI